MTMLSWKLSPLGSDDAGVPPSVPKGWFVDKRTKAIHSVSGSKITDWVIAPIAPAPWQCGQVIIRQGWIRTFRPHLRRYR